MEISATVRVYRHGVSGGVAANAGGGGKRGKIAGWSLGSARSNTRFLYSVREHELTGHGLALSLTVKNLPSSHAVWHKIRTAWIKRLRRLGLIRLHWCVEWQKRGHPHLHAAVFLDGPETPARMEAPIQAWLAVCAAQGVEAGSMSQHVSTIDKVLGWLQYLSKHAARGAGHYQRAKGTMPPGWDSTGRLWGHVGDWPRDLPLEVVLEDEAWFRFRRIMRGARIARARSLRSWGMLRAARRSLRVASKEAGPYRGVSGWIDGPAVEAAAAWALQGVEREWDVTDADTIADEVWGF